jgi:hypothetical protein
VLAFWTPHFHGDGYVVNNDLRFCFYWARVFVRLFSIHSDFGTRQARDQILVQAGYDGVAIA